MSNPAPRRFQMPRWMVIYADLMLLLVGFLVLLLSHSTINPTKFEEMAASLQDALGVRHGGPHTARATPDTAQNLATAFNMEVTLTHLVEKLTVVIANKADVGEAELVEKPEGFVLRIHMEALFTSGTIHLRREAEALLLQIANLLNNLPNHVFVTGHTDNQPVDPSGPFPSNWAFSASQAASIVNLMATKGGIHPSRLEARGMGEFAPLDSNDTDQGRSRNRRIELTISRQLPAATAPGKEAAQAKPAAPPAAKQKGH